MSDVKPFHRLLHTVLSLSIDAVHFFTSCFRQRVSLAAENLFLRKQLAVYVERQVKPRRATDTARLTLVLLSRLFDWRPALIIVKPGHSDWVAPESVLSLLAMEIQTPWATEAAAQSAGLDHGDGCE